MISKFFKKKIRKIHSYFEFISLLRRLQKEKNTNGLFFFFPFVHVGGAERVHIDILSVFKDKNPWIIITNKSDNSSFFDEFNDKGNLFSIGYFGPLRVKIIKKKLTQLINSHPNPVIFGCNSSHFYDILPLIDTHVKSIDLIHAFSGKDYKAAEDWSLPHIDKLNYRIFISKKTIEELKAQYKENNINQSYLDRVKYIPNYTEIPATIPIKDFENIIEVLYVGRGSAEKRVNIIGAIAKACIELRLPVKFTLIGDIENNINSEFMPFVNLTGEITSKDLIIPYYKKSHIILITSTREGFPMVVMEGMAYGCVPMCTDVGDIPVHVINKKNGILISNQQNEKEIIFNFVESIKLLDKNREELSGFSNEAYAYAKSHFKKEAFIQNYQKLFFEN